MPFQFCSLVPDWVVTLHKNKGASSANLFRHVGGVQPKIRHGMRMVQAQNHVWNYTNRERHRLAGGFWVLTALEDEARCRRRCMAGRTLAAS